MRKVKGRAELKVTFTHVPEPRKKGEKTIRAEQKTSGKIVKTVAVVGVEPKVLNERIKKALGIIENGNTVKKVSKADEKGIVTKITKDLNVEFKEKIKNIVAHHTEKVTEFKAFIEKQALIIKDKDDEIEALKALIPTAPVEPDETIEPSTKEGEDSQPIKPTKPVVDPKK